MGLLCCSDIEWTIADNNSSHANLAPAGASSTDGQTQQAELGQLGHAAAANGGQRQSTYASSHAHVDCSPGSAETKSPVEDDLLGIGAQFDAYHEAVIDHHCLFS